MEDVALVQAKDALKVERRERIDSDNRLGEVGTMACIVLYAQA